MLKKLKEKRYSKEITTKEISEHLGISKAFYCQIENGKRRLSYEMAIKIANFFNVKPDSLFYEDVNKYMENNEKNWL